MSTTFWIEDGPTVQVRDFDWDGEPAFEDDGVTPRFYADDQYSLNVTDLNFKCMFAALGYAVPDGNCGNLLWLVHDIPMQPKFIVTDEGEGCFPRYDVIQAPQLGDDVSYSFNGDSYPCGKIITISATMKTIKTSEGKVFYRHRETGSWKSGPWSLIQGTISEQNPHF